MRFVPIECEVVFLLANSADGTGTYTAMTPWAQPCYISALPSVLESQSERLSGKQPGRRSYTRRGRCLAAERPVPSYSIDACPMSLGLLTSTAPLPAVEDVGPPSVGVASPV